MKKLAALTGLGLFLSATVAPAGDNPILGTWKLKSFVRELTGTGEKINQLGEHPDGYISYSADGRMYTIATSDSRAKPRNVSPDDEERVELHHSHTPAPTRWKATR